MSIIDILMLFFACAGLTFITFAIMEVVGNEED